MERRIKAQGDLDGACFLYTLVNAVSCLRGRAISAGGWQRLVGAIYDPRDFLNGDVGTDRIDQYPDLIAKVIGDYVSLLDRSSTYRVERISDLDHRSILTRRLLSRNSVLIVATQAHWFAVVDVDQDEALTACSVEYLGSPSCYVEEDSTRLQRRYNSRKCVKELVLAYRLSI
ncbi:hypothetical protein [Cupriavidus campinensis]|uniref:Uncharacterized protein n=1 Tax=Cupriavidus campinensis TaxID=151783 RepID=A0AAE9I0U1_9BURK|nr:hypothetical protein [Cupriavidus campinensis]URF05049.1 hypothetical protein M5D45_04210 [Cupriavidus campinensis]